MYKKFLVGGVTAAAIIGVAGTSLAVTGSDTTNGTASTSKSTTSSTAKHAKKDAGKKQAGKGPLRHLEHGQFVTKTKKGTVTHDLIRGTVTAVSATSVTVQAADKKSEKFTITKATKVRVRENGKGAASTIGKVAKGDSVAVAGTGTSTFTAKQVVDIKGKKK